MIMKKIFSSKNIILAGGLLIALSTLVSCKKLIEIPANPPTNITRQQVFADSATAISAVAGVYSFTPSNNNNNGIPYFSGYFDVTTSLSAHEVSYTANYGDYTQFYSYTLTPQNQEINALWSSPYGEIYQINDILANITNNGNLSPSLIKQLTGEMEVVRAFVYFYQVNLFGGVPVVTTTDYTTNAQLPRATSAAVYTQILADLNDAVKKLPTTYPSAGHVRPNLYTAVALQAKVHLYQGNWQAAYNEADSVISSGGFSLLTDLNSVFLDGSAEAIWQVPVENAYQGSGDAQNFVPYGGTPNYVVTDSLLSKFGANDLRKADWLGFNVVNNDTLYYAYKYKDLAPTTPATDFMMLRLGEMYLIRAEAAAQLNKLSQAVADVNTIRARAGLAVTTVDATSQKAVLGAVRDERRLELCFEFGNRFFDLGRTSTDSKYPSSGQAPAVLVGWQPDFAIYPVPLTQRQLNSHLTQNPGYH